MAACVARAGRIDGVAGSVLSGSNPHLPHLMAPGTRECADATNYAPVIRSAVDRRASKAFQLDCGNFSPEKREDQGLASLAFSPSASGTR